MQFVQPFLAEKNAIKREGYLRKMFGHYDKDGNKCIDRDEFTQFFLDLLREFDLIPSSEESGFQKQNTGISKDDIIKFLNIVDENHDNQISVQEFINFWNHPLLADVSDMKRETATKLQKKKSFKTFKSLIKESNNLLEKIIVEKNEKKQLMMMKKLFDLYDSDGNSVLDYMEFSKFFLHLLKNMELPKPSDEDISQCMQMIDLDCSGDIDFEEFSSWWFQMMEQFAESKTLSS